MGSAGHDDLWTDFRGKKSERTGSGFQSAVRSSLPPWYELRKKIDANATRDSNVFREFGEVLLSGVHRALKKESRELLYLLDSTPIPLKSFGYDDWARATRSPKMQGLKVHLQIESKDAMPVYLDVTTARVNDLLVGRDIALENGATYVFDKGYYDYNWWYRFHEHNALFITRLKKNAGVEVESFHTLPEECEEDILEDAIIQFKHKHPGGHRVNHHYGTALRRVTINRLGKQRPLILVTNDFSRSAQALSDLYRRRWEIETFFKWLKQNLKIKKFLGRSENAVRIQIYIALITYILLHLYKKRMGLKASLKMIAVGLKTSLFQRPKTEQKVSSRHRLRREKSVCFSQSWRYEIFPGRYWCLTRDPMVIVNIYIKLTPFLDCLKLIPSITYRKCCPYTECGNSIVYLVYRAFYSSLLYANNMCINLRGGYICMP